MGPCHVLVWAITGRNDRRVIAEFEQSENAVADWSLSAEMVVCLWHEEVVEITWWDAACIAWRYEIISHHW